MISLEEMETRNVAVKCKRPFEMEPSEERKRFKVSIQALPTKGSEPTESKADGRSPLSFVIKYCRKQKHNEKVTGLLNNDSPQSETRADQVDDKAHPKQFAGTEKSACENIEQKEEKTKHMSTSRSRGELEIRLRQDPSSDSQEELFREKMVQDGQQLGAEMTKISTNKVAEKEYDDSLRAKVAELRQETCTLTRELQEHATMCMRLSNANRQLMDELKTLCHPCIIDILEAKNPENNPPTD